MKKKLLTCPTCLTTKGKKEILGEIDKDGHFVVRRYTNNATTRIISKEFVVQCGICGDVCFFRRKDIK